MREKCWSRCCAVDTWLFFIFNSHFYFCLFFWNRREKIVEATEVSASELLVRSLKRADARTDDLLRLRAEVKQKAQLTDVSKKSNNSINSGRQRKQKRKKRIKQKRRATTTPTTPTTPATPATPTTPTTAWLSPQSGARATRTTTGIQKTSKSIRKREKKLLRWHQRQQIRQLRGSLVAAATATHATSTSRSTLGTAETTTSSTSSSSSFNIMESFNDAFTTLSTPTLPLHQPQLVQMQLELSGTEYNLLCNRGERNPYQDVMMMDSRVAVDVEELIVVQDGGSGTAKDAKDAQDARDDKNTRIEMVPQHSSIRKINKKNKKLFPNVQSPYQQIREPSTSIAGIPYREHPLFVQVKTPTTASLPPTTTETETPFSKVLISEMKLTKLKRSSKSKKQISRLQRNMKVHQKNTMGAVQHSNATKSTTPTKPTLPPPPPPLVSPSQAVPDPVARATALHRKAIGLSPVTIRSSKQQSFVQALTRVAPVAPPPLGPPPPLVPVVAAPLRSTRRPLQIRFVPASHLLPTSRKRQEKTVLVERAFDLQEQIPLTVGRDAKVCAFTIDSTSYPKILSKVHCVIVCQRGRLFVMDNGSTNGTIVNGTRVDKRKPMPLPSGSLIVFGGKKSDLMYDIVY